MSSNDVPIYKYKNITASALISNQPTRLGGIYCNSTTSGTVKIYDNNAASGTVVLNTTALAVGWNQMPFLLPSGCYITVGNTLDCTVAYL